MEQDLYEMGWIRYPACFSHSAIFGPPSLAACLPLYSNQSSHQSAICQAEYCSFYLIPDKQIRPTLLSHSTALFSLSLPQKLVMNGGYSWLLVSVHGV